MIENLYTFLGRVPHSSPIIMNRMNNYLNILDEGVQSVMDRNSGHTFDPIPSSAIDYINSLIVRADIAYLLKYGNDVDRLKAVVREYNTPNYSDTIRQHPQKRKFLIGGQMIHTSEYLTITDDFNLTDEIPFGEPIENWIGNVRPLRLIDLDSLEVRLDVVSSKLRFNYEPPTQAIFSLNIVKLLMMYTRYRLDHPEEFEERVNNFPFIYKACINPILRDSVRVYWINVIYEMLIGKLENPDYEFDDERILHSQFSYFIRSNRQSALVEVGDLIDKCRRGQAKPDELLIALKVDSSTTILDYLTWIVDSNYVGSGGLQFTWLEFMIQYKILTILIMVFELQPDTIRTKELHRLMRILTNRLKNTRFWAHARNPYVIELLKNNFDYIVEKTKI